MRFISQSLVLLAATCLVSINVNAKHKAPPVGHQEVLPDKCPLIGARPDGSPPGQRERTLNPKKNRRTAPTPQDIDKSVSLAKMLANGNDQTRFDEKKGAEISGYVVNVEQGGHPETANCGNLTEELTDTHITIAVGNTNDLTQTLVIEVTPWWREAMKAQGVDWTTATLRKTIKGKTIKVRGWLLFDLDHIDEAINTRKADAKKNPWRKTIWEIHPVTAIEVIH